MLSLVPPDRRRVVPVRLTEIPLERRLRAAERCLKDEHDPIGRIEIMTCAWHPSSTVHWIAA